MTVPAHYGDENVNTGFPAIKAKPNLNLITHLPGQIYTIDSFLSAYELQTILQWASSLPLDGPKKPLKGEAERTSRRGTAQSPAIAEIITSALLPHLKSLEPPYVASQPLCSPNIRVYHYPPKSFFRGHYDSPQLDPASRRLSCWTVLIYLTDGVVGGGTTFWLDGPPRDESRSKAKTAGKNKVKEAKAAPRKITIEPKAGRVCLHWHGVARGGCMLHEGEEVVRGDKWILRTDVLA